MVERREMGQEERSPSVRYFVLGFLALVALCAVFFSLGFLIGYNQRSSKQMPVAENVSGSNVIPPAVNPPAESSPALSEDAAAKNASSSANKPPPKMPQEVKEAPPEPLRPQRIKKREAAAKTAPKRASKTSSAAHEAAPGTVDSGYSLQVVAARTQETAESLRSRLKSEGYPAYVLSPEAIGARDNYYRVLVGPYRTRDAAEKVRRELERKGLKPFIKH